MKTITIPQIIKLFKKELKTSTSRTGVYYYIYRYKFPRPLGTRVSYNRVWSEARVKKWFKKHRKTLV